MNHRFDELTKNLAQSGTRRAALQKFSVGLASMALACFGLANKSQAGQSPICENCISGCMMLRKGTPRGVCVKACKADGYC
jgi:hypothetical protein